MNTATIIARNYRAYARVLATSYARHHPGERLSVLVIDGEMTAFDGSAEPFETIFPSQLPLSGAEFHRMAAMYDVMELATALKPLFLRFLLGRGAEVAMFLDPDIEVFAPLHELGRLAREKAIVLIPHMRRSIPADGRKPTQADIATSGVYNLGFIAVSAPAGPFLEWWGTRLRRDCLVEPGEQLFVDQRVLDFVPGYLNPFIVQDPAYDVAYWNLHERRLTWNGTGYEVAGELLRFFHFSGFDPLTPHLLSKHQGANPRILLSEEPDLARLCREYAERVLAAGHRTSVDERYGFAATARGVPFDRRMRRLYREGLLAAERGQAAEPPNPFDAAGADAFIGWLNSPPDASAGPTRYLQRLYEERPDLRVAFPDLAGGDLRRYAEWVRLDGRADPPVPAVFRSSAMSRGEPRRLDGAEPMSGSEASDMGVNIAGYVRAELGIGEGARLTIAAVKAAGLPYSVVAFDETSSRQQQVFSDYGTGRPVYGVNLVQVNGDMFPRFAERYGRDLLEGRYTVGIWAWEVEAFPADMARAQFYVDEIWAVSEFAAAAIGRAVSKPVFAFPHPVIAPSPEGVTRAELGLPEAFVFLFCFDFFSVMERKNPLGLIEAFCRAFAPHEGPVLVIKTINGSQAMADLEKLRAAAGGRADIRIIDGYLPQPRVHALMQACDAYVSLHRGEGFGLTLAECMALGKPVIATAYSGNLDFMNEGNSYLVPAALTPIPPGCGPYPPEGRWAAPDVAEAARLMRHVLEHPDEAGKVGQRAREEMLRLHSPEVRASFIRSRLSAIGRTRRANRGGTASPPTVSPSEGWHRMAAVVAEIAGAGPHLGSRHALVRFVQRVLLRLLRPLLNHERAVVDKLIAALAEVERTVDERYLTRRAELEGALHERTRVRLAELERTLDERYLTRRAELEGALHERTRVRLAELERTLDERRQAGGEELQRQIAARVDSASRESAQLVERAAAEMHTNTRAHLDAMARALDEARQQGETRWEALRRLSEGAAQQVERLVAELHVTAHVWDPSLVAGLPDASGRAVLGYHSSTGGPVANPYLRFEEIFRGPEALIKERQRGYLKLLRGRHPVVDVGCGRGELLDLCQDAGIPARGVDSDPGMVARCRAKGHDVDCVDALAYLDRQPNGALGAIVSVQFIEHLPYVDLIRFLQLSYRKLAGNGLFVAETVNPHSIQAFKAFWTDLTHQRPIFPETLLALCRLYGFEEASVVFPGGTGDLHADRWRQGDYAVVAKRGVAALDNPETASGP